MRAAEERALHRLREEVRAGARNLPGTYRMLGPTGTTLYVGKSKRLRTRLLGYFRARRGEKAWRIIRDARALDWEYAPNEFESLLRELELIKRYRPPYNVQRKRDRAYSFLKLSAGAAPRFQLVRQVGGEPGDYFGPFRRGKRIAAGIRELNDVLLLRDCAQRTPIHFADQSDFFVLQRTPLCARFELRRCAGPCAGGCTEGEYRRRIDLARRFLRGEGEEPMIELGARMERASELLHFEQAAALRDRIARLEELRAEFTRLREEVERLTFLYRIPGPQGDDRIYAIRQGVVRSIHSAPSSAGERRVLLEQLRPIYESPGGEVPFGSGRHGEEVLLIAHWFRTHPAELHSTYPPERWSALPLRAARATGKVA